MDDDDWFKIYKVNQDDSFSVLKGLFVDTQKKNRRSSKKTNSLENRKKRIALEKKKLLNVVVSDLILEYRFALSYLYKIGTLDNDIDKKTIKMLIQLASHSMSYSISLHSIAGKLGEKSGKISLPYRIKDNDEKKIILSHIYIEKKILESYKQILDELELDKWLSELLKFIIEKKSKNLKELLQYGDFNESQFRL